VSAAAILAHQLHLVHLVAARNLEGMSAEDSLVQPPGRGNCANWILGHLVNIHNQLAEVLGVAPVWEAPELERAGPEPIRDAGGAIDWHELVARFAAAETRMAGALEALSDEELAEVISTPVFGGSSSRPSFSTRRTTRGSWPRPGGWPGMPEPSGSQARSNDQRPGSTPHRAPLPRRCRSGLTCRTFAMPSGSLPTHMR